MKNIVYIDLLCAQPFGSIKFHGGGEYTKAVFKQVANFLDNKITELTVLYNFDLFIDEWILDIIKKQGIHVIDVKSYSDIAHYINNLSFCENVTFFAGLINQYANVNITKSVRTIGTCHGLRQLEKDFDIAQYFYTNSFKDILRSLYYHINRRRLFRANYNLYKNCLLKFNNIVTVSNHSQYSIRNVFGTICEGKKIMTLYTPSKVYDKTFSIADENFIMMVSADRWIKNSYRGVMAIDALYSQGLIPGMKTKIYGNLPRYIRNKIKNLECFEFYGYVSTNELEQAYSQCSLFFYPTLNEGFGMPPIEAQKYGKTCIISAVASLTEVYADSVYYCNPYDIQEMSTRILEAYNERIHASKILNNVERISSKQKDDLVMLAKLILNQ